MNEPMSERQGPVLDAPALRAAGREPPVPFRVRLAGGGEITVLRLLRVLPGKRIVGEGTRASGQRLLVKLFIDDASARRWRQERDGIDALVRAGIPTPQPVFAQTLDGGGHVLATVFLEHAETLLDAWLPFSRSPAGNSAATALLRPAFALLGRAHAAGLSHSDVHLGNFLRHNGELLLIDGDAVRRHRAPLGERGAARDLAMLLAQLPRAWDGATETLLDAYRQCNPQAPGQAALTRALSGERAWRLHDYLGKTRRDCTLFQVEHTFSRFTVVVRKEAAALAAFLREPDHFLRMGTLLKHGNTCTVARIDVDGHALVVKRYNIKNRVHALSRCWRPSRGWRSWREAHRLQLFGIPTPAPLALIEERIGPLRGRAWLITEYCPGTDLSQLLDAAHPPPAPLADALPALFATLFRERISHGDLKAANLLWDGNQLQLIDLDAMRQHRSARAYARAWRRDRARLLRNWPDGSVLRRWLDTRLPPAL